MTEPAGIYFGASVPRREDERLLMGAGKFAADLRIPGMVEAAFLRSPLAAGRVVRLDAREALDLDGVIAVYTAADLEGKVESFTRPFYKSIDPEVQRLSGLQIAPYRADLLAKDRVIRLDEPLAVVVALDRYIAEDALETIQLDIEPLPVVSNVTTALAPGAPQVNPDIPGNVHASFRITVGQPDQALATSPHQLSETIEYGRSVGSPMETRGVVASPDPGRGTLTVWANNQRPHLLRTYMAEMLGLPDDHLRVIAPEIGGSFGGGIYAEEIVVAAIARDLGRPVRWIEDRRENLGNARQSRDQTHRVEVGFDDEGRILALKDWFALDCGAYNPFAITIPYNTASHMRGQFRIDNFESEAVCVATNKLPNTPVRGAGRPVAVFVMDRIIDLVADETGLDPVEVRRRNLIPGDLMPYDMGMLYRDGAPIEYDTGDFTEQLEKLVTVVDLNGFRREQAELRASGRLIGIGLSSHVEGSGYGPYEGAKVRVDNSGHVTVHTGTTTHGQSHETTLAQVCADALGVDLGDVTVRFGDTDLISHGGGTYASRVAVTGGSAVHMAAELAKAKVVAIAAGMLEASPEDLEVAGGRVYPRGSPEVALSLAEIAQAAAPGGPAWREGIEPGIEEQSFYVPPTVVFASGSHAAVVEVDRETGVVEVLRYVVVDECGRVINPMVVDGQQHGGVAHGVGNALLEQVIYDAEGQLLTGSFVDYLLPSATDVPRIEVHHQAFPTERNPIGVKGVGEGATSSAPAAIAGAIVDALRPLRVRLNRLPISPARLRELIEEAELAAQPAGSPS
ncbi:MAG: xanthine dehydrogenase family protein molybdopterin-binding subunit [Acidimicrobiia bacterium]